MMMFKQKREIILASGSPRRKAYMERYHLNFKIRTADVDERVREGESPIDYAKRLSREKADTVALAAGDRDVIIIAADTIVVLGDRVLGKPASRADVLPMLEQLNGAEHEVITSFFIFDNSSRREIQRDVSTRVVFHELPVQQLSAYAALDEPLDKAGAYSIQGIGTFLVKSIQGSYNNVVGLPIELLLQDLIEFGCLACQPSEDVETGLHS